MKDVPVALQNKEIVFPKLHLDLTKLQTIGNLKWNIGGLIVYKQSANELEIGIQAKTEMEDAALFEVRGSFDVRDFDPKSEDDLDAIRMIGFGFLFPYLRSAVSQTFGLAGVSVPPFPVIYIRDFFGNVPLRISKD